MATAKKKRMLKIFVGIIGAGAAVCYFKNPNLRAWKNEAGELVTGYPMTWSFLNSNVGVAGRSDLSAKWVGNKMIFTNGAVWTL